MPRSARLVLPGFPHHVIHRGVNRAATFIDDSDKLQYLRLLRNACRKHGVQIHAFVLMNNHVHLLVTPTTAPGLACAMHATCHCYVRYFNTRHGRSGTLWEGRYKSCLVDSDQYFLMVCRYIELNPVRAALVALPEHYPWSSVHAHLGRRRNLLLTPHPVYLSLGDTDEKRALAYAAWMRQAVAQEESGNIRRYIAQQRALGAPRFQEMVARTMNRVTTTRAAGRPRKDAAP